MMTKQGDKTIQNVSDLVNDWLHSMENRIARSTYVKYEQLARSYIIPYFRTTLCEELDNTCLNHFYNEINCADSLRHKSLSVGNRRTIFMIVNNTLDYAYESRQLDQKYHIKPRLTKTRKVVRVFSREDQKKIEVHALNHENSCTLAVMLALYTGLRLGEICALQWRDISFEINSLCVNKTVQRLRVSEDSYGARTELMISHPKSAASNRLLPLPAFLSDYLKRFPCSTKDTYVLTDRSTPMEPRTIQYHYQRMLKSIGVPYLNFHCLRHTFATRCVMLGWDVKTLSEVLGHFDIKITMEYYFHSSFEYKQVQMDKLILLSQN